MTITLCQEYIIAVMLLYILDITYIDIAQNLTTQWGKNMRYCQFSGA